MEYPKYIEINSPYYGNYILTPVFYINILQEPYNMWGDCISEIYSNFITHKGHLIKEINGSWVEYIIYIPLVENNKDWYKNNLNCDYIKNNDKPLKILPFLHSKIKEEKIINKLYNKYPIIKL